MGAVRRRGAPRPRPRLRRRRRCPTDAPPASASRSSARTSTASWIQERTEGVLTIVDAALYKSLHRLERQGLVAGEWGVTDANRRAKFYRLTAAGRRALQDETSAWERYAAAVHRVLAPA